MSKADFAGGSPTDCAAARADATIEELLQRIESLERQLASSSDCDVAKRLNLAVFSGELDRLMAAFLMATGGAACGMQVTMFFTFWATPALKKTGRQAPGKRLTERLFGWMLPSGPGTARLSRMDLLGAGRWMMKREMAAKGVADLPTLMRTAEQMGVRVFVCEMSMQLMGIRREELIDYAGLECCGVARFLEHAAQARTTLVL